MKCYQCNNLAMYMVGPEGQQVPLCLECNLKYVQIISTQNEFNMKMINYLSESMEVTAGLSSFLPRFPEKKIINTGEIILNNIKIDNSTIGMINTGNIQSIDMAVTNLNQIGDDKIASALKELSETILKNDEINSEIKNQLIELLSAIALEATMPKEKFRKAIFKPLIVELSTILGGIASLSQLWDKLKPIFDSLLN